MDLEYQDPKTGYRIELDLRTQVLGVDVTPACARPPEPRLHKHASRQVLSASVLAYKAKVFDDGLMAAVDLAAQRGDGEFAGKAALLQTLCAAISTWKPNEAADIIHAAAELGGIKARVPASHRASCAERIRRFDADPLASKPVAHYTWSPELSRVFRQDRMLQSEIRDLDSANRLARFLSVDTKTARIYVRCLELQRLLTNPPPAGIYDLRVLASDMDTGLPDSVRIFPPSDTPEGSLVKTLFHNRPIPGDFSLVDELIRCVKKGAVDLSPNEHSGWYAYLMHALEPLLRPDQMPEARRLKLSQNYRRHLEELFRAFVALTRETHVKNAQTAAEGACADERIVEIVPLLSVEPLPGYYHRRAAAYGFVRRVLEKAFGEEAATRMRRITPEGPRNETLPDELTAMETLFQGACRAACRQLGLDDTVYPEPGYLDAREVVSSFLLWKGSLASDPDLATDIRMMVPVFHDIQRGKTKVWIVLGWNRHELHVSFHDRPGVRVWDLDDTDRTGDVRLDWSSLHSDVWHPVMRELYVSHILDREKFRALCDREETPERIVAALRG